MSPRRLLPVLLLLAVLVASATCKKQPPRVTSTKIEEVPPPPAPKPPEPRRKLPAREIPPHQPGTLLGGELGLDHVGIAVRDLEAAKKSYEKLGFANPSMGKLPNGIQNINYYFKDTTYLETMSAWDPKKVPWLSGFTAKHEGAYFLALCVHSAEETSQFLKKRGFETLPPKVGSIAVAGGADPEKEMWKTLFFKKSPFPTGSFFFIAYDRQIRQTLFDRLKEPNIARRHFSHPNTALGVRAVWMAVKSAETTLKAFAAMGLPAGRAVELAALGARGRLVQAGIGAIVVLEPADPKGVTARFLADRGEGLVGLSVQVRHLGFARMRIEKNLGRPLDTTAAFYGEALLLPPELTHGAWMEMSQ